MALEPAVATLLAKLITAGIDSYKAADEDGWGTADAKAFGSWLATLPAFRDAWRRHWVYSEFAAPEQVGPVRRWFTRDDKNERLELVEACFRASLFDASLSGVSLQTDLELIEQIKRPRLSQWYRALWSTLMDGELQALVREFFQHKSTVGAALPLLDIKNASQTSSCIFE